METQNADQVKVINLSKKDVIKAFWKWTFFSHSNYNYERLQATGILQSMSHIGEKLYGDNPEEYKAFMKRHMSFYNTEPHFGGIINGMVIAMEEERANGASEITDEAINSVKTGLMGPLAGIGDTLWQGTLQPILLALGISIASAGNLSGPLLYVVLMAGIMLPIGYLMYMRGYKLGKSGLEMILGGNQMKKIISSASIMGAMVLGALAASYVIASSTMNIKLGDTQLSLQTDILDKLFEGILPLGIVMLTFYLLKNKQMKSTKVLLILVILGAILGITGIL